MLICAPTGAGKTVIMAELCRRLLQRYEGVSVLILAHRKELIEQTEHKLLTVWPQAPVGVYSAALDRREVAQITVGSRDTVAPVIDKLGQFSFLIIDEAHRVSVKDEGRYRAIIARLKEQYPSLVVIGFTATPFRLGQGRIYGPGKLFTDLAYRIGLRTLIDAGHLVDYRFPLVAESAVIDTEGLRTVGGDFDEGELAERATADGMVRAAVLDWMEQATQRRASVFFCVSILHAEMVAEELLRHGILCPVVTGKTPASERSEALERFAAGAFRAIANVGVLTEGWDCPICDCIVLLRPTQSAALYVQMVGRGLRLSDDKPDCLLLDYGGNVERLGKPEDAQEKEPKAREKKEPGAPGAKRCGEWAEGTDGAAGQWIHGCGAENAVGAKECCQCGQPFFKHQVKAYGTDAQGRRLHDFEVESITASLRTSASSGRDYVRVAYNCGLFQTYYKNVMLGYDGYAGEKAVREWAQITGASSFDVYQVLEQDGLAAVVNDFEPAAVRAITVDLASKWKDIVKVDYAND